MTNKAEGQHELNFEAYMPRDVKLMTANEIYSDIDILRPVDMKENPYVERKSVGIHQKDLGDYFSIFGNTPPDGGIVLIGVEDDGTVRV